LNGKAFGGTNKRRDRTLVMMDEVPENSNGRPRQKSQLVEMKKAKRLGTKIRKTIRGNKRSAQEENKVL